MDSTQQRRADTQQPLTRRSPAGPSSVGGRFVAHGLKPRTFGKIPKAVSRKNVSRASTEASIRAAISHERLLAKTRKQQKGSEQVQEHNARQAVERKSGFTTGMKCTWCLAAFGDQRLYSHHRNVCPSRPGGPLETGPLRGAASAASGSIPCQCDCGAKFITRSAKRRHVASAECPLETALMDSMCWVCGRWFVTRGQQRAHRRGCVKEGAD